MQDYQYQFIRYALDCGVLKFGDFQLKSGRRSPYFFNTGLFNTGAMLDRLGQFYAQAIIDAGVSVDVLYGPAYKGIPLVSATAIAYARMQSDIPFTFNRKEAKDHGEGGVLVGAPLQGRVWILDDVITAGTSVRESVDIIRAAGAEPEGVVIALDRQEKGQNQRSAVQEVESQFGIQVLPIITLADIVVFIEREADYADKLSVIREYREQYGL
ncbi:MULTISPECIES: orotate phosphoribosyltransferase [Methylomonas]|uniref:Orotate phosphoribosyltransferase n=1 Tax=Methylomonas koyamae TaxID=702114 RepID=A0A177N4U1_9GAMM|nr:orotate phosphoribosyltransferase [Methylomonas koyamae]NJA04599.1 orotate phosphoribosyltransferase [Methylococcaceae bacterium WWC4]OAI12624.1 orotate phosphoribosyltransferase [Methylomonas koyamae]